MCISVSSIWCCTDPANVVAGCRGINQTASKLLRGSMINSTWCECSTGFVADGVLTMAHSSCVITRHPWRGFAAVHSIFQAYSWFDLSPLTIFSRDRCDLSGVRVGDLSQDFESYLKSRGYGDPDELPKPGGWPTKIRNYVS